MRLVGDGLIVDVQKPGIEPVADGERAADIGENTPAERPYSLWLASCTASSSLPIEVIADAPLRLNSR